MSTTDESTAVHAEIVVDVPREHAFAVFTEQFDAIKPREHNLLDVPVAETVFERHVGGAVYDRGVDGTECRWARVLAYDPPAGFVISWDIGPTWQVETDPDRTSEVAVTFTAQGPERTLVEVEHRHLERHGDGWSAVRDGVRADGGWPLYLERFARTAHSAR